MQTVAQRGALFRSGRNDLGFTQGRGAFRKHFSVSSVLEITEVLFFCAGGKLSQGEQGDLAATFFFLYFLVCSLSTSCDIA